jgi:hypothetical protein
LQLFLILWLISLGIEIALPRQTTEERMARRCLLRGPLSRHFFGFAIFLGAICPLGILILFGYSPALVSLAAILALFGLFWFEYVWVRAGQSAPLS